MPNKTQIYAQMADDTARKITGDYLDWAAFLNTSSRLYKYPFHDQLMIYAQRPDATACATYDLWNDTMRRYIRRGSKGIALLTPGPYGMDIRYVFDVSDTGTRRNSRNVEPWALSDAAREPVQQMLIDEEGKLKKGPVSINCLASDLYGADRHGDAIVGNVMIVRAEDERLTLLTKDEANALAAGMEAMRDQAVEKISAAFGLKPIVKPELEIVDLSRRQSCRKNSMER